MCHGHLAHNEHINSRELVLCSASNLKNEGRDFNEHFQSQSEKYSKSIVDARTPDQSHRKPTVFESQRKKHTEQVEIFTLGEVGGLDFPQFPVGSENLTFKAQMCHL